MPRHTRRSSVSSVSRVSSASVRTVPSSTAVSGMTLVVVPAVRWAMVRTAGSKALTRLLVIVCSAPTIAAAAGTGSSASCGAEACPPAPCTVTVKSSDEAMIESARVCSVPEARREVTCSAIADVGRLPPASSRPSSSIASAPWRLSSPGWNMNTTVPARRSRRWASSRAAEASIAVCRSCPHACIAPSIREAYSSPLSSRSGSASMSARSSTDGPGRLPVRVATTELGGASGGQRERQVAERGEHRGLRRRQLQPELRVPVQGAAQGDRVGLQRPGLGQQSALRGAVRRPAPTPGRAARAGLRRRAHAPILHPRTPGGDRPARGRCRFGRTAANSLSEGDSPHLPW